MDDTPAKRLQKLREERFGTHSGAKAEAADAIGILRPTYYGHENGSRGLTAKTARTYADFFHVRFEWLLQNRGTRKENQKDPTLARIERLPSDLRAYVEQALEFAEFQASKRKK